MVDNEKVWTTVLTHSEQDRYRIARDPSGFGVAHDVEWLYGLIPEIEKRWSQIYARKGSGTAMSEEERNIYLGLVRRVETGTSDAADIQWLCRMIENLDHEADSDDRHRKETARMLQLPDDTPWHRLWDAMVVQRRITENARLNTIAFLGVNDESASWESVVSSVAAFANRASEQKREIERLTKQNDELRVMVSAPIDYDSHETEEMAVLVVNLMMAAFKRKLVTVDTVVKAINEAMEAVIADRT
jgi:hypothetical protein